MFCYRTVLCFLKPIFCKVSGEDSIFFVPKPLSVKRVFGFVILRPLTGELYHCANLRISH